MSRMLEFFIQKVKKILGKFHHKKISLNCNNSFNSTWKVLPILSKKTNAATIVIYLLKVLRENTPNIDIIEKI